MTSPDPLAAEFFQLAANRYPDWTYPDGRQPAPQKPRPPRCYPTWAELIAKHLTAANCKMYGLRPCYLRRNEE